MSEFLPATETEPTSELRIYVASLSDYNNGLLHGAWLDAARDVEALQTDISAMLAASPTMQRYGEPAEEWAIHDYEGFGPLRLGEYEPIERIAALAAGIEEHGPAFAAFAATEGEADGDLAEQFEERFCGEWESVETYAEELLNDCGAEQYLGQLPEWLQAHVRLDVEGFARDLVLGGDVHAVERPGGGVWIFRS